MMNAAKQLEGGRPNIYKFVMLANSAVEESLQLISKLVPEPQRVWPQWRIQMYSLTAKFMHGLADQTQNRELLKRALPLQEAILKHTDSTDVNYMESLVEASQLQVELTDFCGGVERLEEFTDIQIARQGGDPKDLATKRVGRKKVLQLLPVRSKHQYTLGAHQCNPHLSLELFNNLLDLGHLSPSNPQACMKCWGIHGIVLRTLGRAEEAEKYFYEELKPHVAWHHHTQMPSTYNIFLATKEPEYFLDTTKGPSPESLHLLHKYRDVITNEYLAYERYIETPGAVNGYDPNHEDSWMSKTTEEESWWEYLKIRLPSGRWDEKLCRDHFPKTCRMFRDLDELNAFPSQAKCKGYCPNHAAGKSGMLAFYRLAPGKHVAEHNGGNNMRLKCHLVIRAPPKHEENPAYLQVADTKKKYDTGETFCFDDSFIHQVHNGGGKYKNITRVVFDIALWHPKLYTTDLMPRSKYSKWEL